MRSRVVFLFFVPKMCPKCDSLGATFVLNASQKGGARGKRTKVIEEL